MERKFLEGLGVDKEVIDKIMAENGKDIERQKQQLTAERDGLKAQLDSVNEKLKSFGGVDVTALKGEIETLKKDIAAKDADYQKQIAERDFDAVITAEINAAKGKNAKAIMATLDLDALRASKNQKEDIVNALKKVQETDGYLFEAKSTRPVIQSDRGENFKQQQAGSSADYAGLAAELVGG